MNLMMALLGSLGRILPITVSADWGSDLGASPLSSASRTLTVPSGNPGTIRFEIILNEGTLEYKKNAAAFAAVTDGATLSVANSDTIQFRYTGSSATGANVEVYDHTTGTLVGSWSATIL
jgi:hypothetical protein